MSPGHPIARLCSWVSEQDGRIRPIPGSWGWSTKGSTMKRQPRSGKPWEKAFDAFWELWPYKVNVGQAESTFCRMFQAHEMPVTIILKIAIKVQQQPGGCLERRARVNGTDPRPHPSTWLSGKRWLDEVQPDLPAHEQKNLTRHWDDEAREALERRILDEEEARQEFLRKAKRI